jgi:hypothetical protein
MSKFNFSNVKLTTIEGKDVPKSDLHKTLGNALYAGTKDLALVEVAKKIHAGEEVELDKTEIAEVKRVIEDPQVGFLAFVKKALLDYIDSIK